MFGRLARLIVRRRIVVLVAMVAVIAVSGIFGGGVVQYLSGGGFADPDAESSVAGRALEELFDTGDPNVILLVTAKDGSVDAPEVAAAGSELTQELGAEAGVEQAISYWTLGSAPPLRSTDSSQALVLARITGDEEAVAERAEVLAEEYTREDQLLSVGVGGTAEVFRTLTETIEEDLIRAEQIALPVTLVLLVLVFGSVVAALLPLTIGIVAVLGTFLILRLLTGVTDVSIFALNLTTALGLGLAIDYSLFIVSRFREELGAGQEPHDAVLRTVRTAGKTVAFSAATVAISLAALLVFPLMFLRSFAYAGIAVVAFAALGSLVFLPAILAVLGRRIDRLTLFRRGRSRGSKGFWHRVAVAVMRRPIPIATVVIALLLVLGAPFLNIEFGQPDDRVLPADTSVRGVSDQIRTNFESVEGSALSIVATGVGDPDDAAAEIRDYAAALSGLAGVARVDALTGTYIDGAQAVGPNPLSSRFAADDATWLSVVPEVEPISPEGEALVADVRGVQPPFEVAVTGRSAELVDSKDSLFARVPLAGGIIALVTFTALFLMFGSLLVPAKAVVLNLLSLTATFGAMVWIFQEGHYSDFLGFTPTGLIDTTMPILMFCIAFGLSMDYEVFLLSRIKEEHDHGRDNIASVAFGLERTGRIVTAAAVVLAVVFLAFATSGITTLKLLGLGMALAVLMDATLIRATLVPAFMRLAGDANWWAPGPLRRVYERYGISESDSEPEATPTVEAASTGSIS